MPSLYLDGETGCDVAVPGRGIFFTTFGGEALSLAAAVATIQEMIEKDVPAYLAAKGKKLKMDIMPWLWNQALDGYTRCTGYDCRSLVSFDAAL